MRYAALAILLVIAVVASPAPAQTPSPTSVPTPTPCDWVDLESVAYPPDASPVSALDYHDDVVLPRPFTAGETGLVRLKFSHRTCTSPAGDRFGELCRGDQDCPTLGVIVPYACTRSGKTPDALEFVVIDEPTGQILAQDMPPPAANLLLYLPDTAMTIVGTPTPGERQGRRLGLRWTFACGEARRDVRFTLRVPEATP